MYIIYTPNTHTYTCFWNDSEIKGHKFEGRRTWRGIWEDVEIEKREKYNYSLKNKGGRGQIRTDMKKSKESLDHPFKSYTLQNWEIWKKWIDTI